MITQLLDKYLVNQNYIFKKPNLETKNKLKDMDFNFEEPTFYDELPNGGGKANKSKCFSINEKVNEDEDNSTSKILYLIKLSMCFH